MHVQIISGTCPKMILFLLGYESIHESQSDQSIEGEAKESVIRESVIRPSVTDTHNLSMLLFYLHLRQCCNEIIRVKI